jgi:hypothetical protein
MQCSCAYHVYLVYPVLLTFFSRSFINILRFEPVPMNTLRITGDIVEDRSIEVSAKASSLDAKMEARHP